MNVYYENITMDGWFINDEPANPPIFDPNWSVITQEQYITAVVAYIQSIEPAAGQLVLQYSRSANRTNPQLLHDGVLDVAKSYAIFIPDLTTLYAYSQVEFFLDAVSVNVEASAPWDYAGTAGGGGATLTTFLLPGTHTIDAVVTHPGGTFTISADFEVN